MLHARDCAYFLFKRCTCDAGEGHETDAQGNAVPLQIVSSDVISLNTMYRDLMELVASMEAAHAAEVARLREARAALAAWKERTAAIDSARAGGSDDSDLCRCGPQTVAPYAVFCPTCKRVTPEARAVARAGGGR